MQASGRIKDTNIFDKQKQFMKNHYYYSLFLFSVTAYLLMTF